MFIICVYCSPSQQKRRSSVWHGPVKSNNTLNTITVRINSPTATTVSPSSSPPATPALASIAPDSSAPERQSSRGPAPAGPPR